MPLISIPPVEIEINIPDLVIGDIKLKRTAKLFTLTYNQHTKTLSLSWIVTYTDIADIRGVHSYTKESIADNTTMVDVATGAILLPIEDKEGNQVLDKEGNPTYPGNYIGQYDWFNMIAEKQSLNVHELIRAYGHQADWSH